MDGDHTSRTTKRSLIDRTSPPTGRLDADSVEQSRSIVTGSKFRWIRRGCVNEHLGIYPNIFLGRTDYGVTIWGGMPSTRDGLGRGKQAGCDEAVWCEDVATVRGQFHFCIDTLKQKMNALPIEKEAGLFSEKIVGRKLPYFQSLARYAVRVEGNPHAEMSLDEKRALLQCLSLIGREYEGYKVGGKEHFVMPEAFTRFVNPLGCMGNTPSYEGLTAYFFDLGQRVQHHLFSDGYDYSDKNNKTQKFFEIHHVMNLPEAARLLGNAARHWGVDKIRTQADRDDFAYRMTRLNLYLSCAKMTQCIKERANGVSHALLFINKEDAQTLIEYGQKGFHDYYKLSVTRAEQELMDQINQMNTPSAPEYKEMQRLLSQGDPEPTDDAPRFAIYQYALDDEKFHAKNFLQEHDGEGERLVFG